MKTAEERAVVIASALPEAETLEGLYLRAPAAADTRGAIIAAPHPLYGGSMDSPVVSELAYAAYRAGVASLRFNWRGVGASAGAASGDLRHGALDAAAALGQIAATVTGPLTALGYSFGAAALVRLAAIARSEPTLSAQAAWPRVQRLVLVAPPPSLLDVGALGAFRGALLVIAAADDAIAPAPALERVAAALPEARCIIVPEADHFFGVGLGAVGRATREWLAAV
jgi:alpha/beta superfamily hydrolase